MSFLASIIFKKKYANKKADDSLPRTMSDGVIVTPPSTILVDIKVSPSGLSSSMGRASGKAATKKEARHSNPVVLHGSKSTGDLFIPKLLNRIRSVSDFASILSYSCLSFVLQDLVDRFLIMILRTSS